MLSFEAKSGKIGVLGGAGNTSQRAINPFTAGRKRVNYNSFSFPLPPIIGGSFMPARNTPEKFWANVGILSENDCWEWKLGKVPDGYGYVKYQRKSLLAHRLSYILTYGEVPEGQLVCYHCDNPPCCNPAHLFLGTDLDNSRDKYSKGRANHPKGTSVGTVKLSEQDVLEVRRLYATGNYSKETLGEMFGCTLQNIYRIVNNITWRHLLDE